MCRFLIVPLGEGGGGKPRPFPDYLYGGYGREGGGVYTSSRIWFSRGGKKDPALALRQRPVARRKGEEKKRGIQQGLLNDRLVWALKGTLSAWTNNIC